MIQQSNALRRLEEILTRAVDSGKTTQLAGLILAEAMDVEPNPHNIVGFYGLLSKAEEEAKCITKPKIDRYLRTIKDLHNHFIVQHIWGMEWGSFSRYIEDKGVLNTLDSLADFFCSEHPVVFLEKDFLENLNSEFSGLLDEILRSDLSRELKRFLKHHIEDLLGAIRRYQIDGSEGLKKAAQSITSDLLMTENSLKDADKKNPTYMRIKAWGLSLLLYIAPSPYDIIGAVPDIHEFWMPKFEELSTGHKKVEKIISETSTIQEAVEKSISVFDRQQQKSLSSSKELKALPASKNDAETTPSDTKNP